VGVPYKSPCPGEYAYETDNNSCPEDLLAFLREAYDDLAEKGERFSAFLQMGDAELQQNPEFTRFLVSTTDELIERAIRLNSLVRTRRKGRI
jgi:hypothetical protein